MSERIDHVTVCRACRSMRLQVEAWTDVNRWVAKDGLDGDYWCPKCDEHFKHHSVAELIRQPEDGSWVAFIAMRPSAPHRTLREAIRAVAARKIPNWKLTKDATK